MALIFASRVGSPRREGSASRRTRLAHLIDLACASTGLSKDALGRRLGRDGSKLVSSTALPKLDVVVGLADALGWPVERIVDLLVPPVVPAPDVEGMAFDDVERLAVDAYVGGRIDEMFRHVGCLHALSRTPEQRARACLREAGVWDAKGWPERAVDVAHMGLREPGISAFARDLLRVNLAGAHAALGRFVESRALAAELIVTYDGRELTQNFERTVHAVAHFVRALSLRAAAMARPADRSEAIVARDSLSHASDLLDSLALKHGLDSYAGFAHTCRAGAVQMDALLGDCPPDAALAHVFSTISRVTGPDDGLYGDHLESHGWWCVFGCEIAEARLVGDDRARALAILTNKAGEIADRLGNWLFWERVLQVEYRRRQNAGDSDLECPWTLDGEDIRVLVGVMGRFPRFWETGWRILGTAQIID